MTERGQIWKCEVCGNIVEVLHEGADSLVCCGKSMGLMVENSVDAAAPKGVPPAQMASDESDKVGKKHVPVVDGDGVSVGSVLHPMDKDHYIEWIEATDSDGKVIRRFLNPGDKPVVDFCFDIVSARAYCNLHGLWKS